MGSNPACPTIGGDPISVRDSPILPSVFRVSPAEGHSRVRWRLFLSTALGSYLVTANISTMNVAFPGLEASFAEATRGTLTWVLNSYTIAFAALLIPAGRLADRFGRRQLFWAGLAIFGGSSVLVGAAPNLAFVISARTLQGVGGALVTPSSLGLLLADTPSSLRTTTVAKWGAITALGVATGPSVGALIIDATSWRWAFLLLPVACFAAYGCGRGHLPDTEVNKQSPFPDVWGAFLLAAAMALLAFSIVQVRPWGLLSLGVQTSFALGLLIFFGVISRSRGHVAAAIPLELFKIRTFVWANVATLIQSFSLSASLLVNILWLTEGWRYSIATAGLATTASPLLVALLAPVAGRYGSYLGIRRFAIPGSLAWGVGNLLYVLLITERPAWLFVYLPISLLVGVGVATTFPLVSAAAVIDVGPSDYAVAGAILQVARQFGATIGVASLISLVGESAELNAYKAAWLVVAISGGVSAIALIFVGDTRR
ncbi:MAG TPA: MFS transporter [Acidimicrobiales bacterium]|nr:MFS transporter [Acidimicrobiales bacterium]